jgi:uncharacterized protein (TIGR00106 family)
MLVDLTIDPDGRGTHLSKDLAEILKIVDASSLPYSLTPFGTCIEGDWDQVMGLVKQCHALAKASSHHMMTSIQIEDENRAVNKLDENVAAVERLANHKFTRLVRKVVEAEELPRSKGRLCN